MARSEPGPSVPWSVRPLGTTSPPAAEVRTPAAGGPRPPARPAATIDAAGLLVAPGLVDLQCNGAGGIDLSAEPGRLWEVAALLPRWEVTAWLPTIVTGPPEVRAQALAALRAGPPPGIDGARCATPLGLHLEGRSCRPSGGCPPGRAPGAPGPGARGGRGWSAAGAWRW